MRQLGIWCALAGLVAGFFVGRLSVTRYRTKLDAGYVVRVDTWTGTATARPVRVEEEAAERAYERDRAAQDREMDENRNGR